MDNCLKVGTDCSGIEAPIQALKKMKIEYSHKFSSENDEKCIESLLANYDPETLYRDIRKRDNTKKEVEKVDLYVCGFPCQTFSMAGERKGDRDERGQIFWYCYDYIKNKKPKYFLLENVKGLLSINNGRTFVEIIESLVDLGIYNVYWEILNTKD